MKKTVTKTLEVCDRDQFGKARVATQTRVYSLENRWYRLRLCDEHAEMFDRDMGRWTHLSEEIDPPTEYVTTSRVRSEFFTAELLEDARRTTRIREAAEAARRQAASEEFARRRRAEIDAETALQEEEHAFKTIPNARLWRLSQHARQRMGERGFDVDDVLRTATTPMHTYRQPWRGDDIAIYQRGDCRIAVNDTERVIITVIDRSDTLETESTHHDHAQHRTSPNRAMERTAL